MGKRIKVSGLIVILFFLGLVTCVYAEDVTITTYYPSPFGSYRDLEVTNRATFGPFSVFGAGVVAPGSIVLSGNTAGVYIVDRNLAVYPGTAGSAYAFYNQGSSLRLWTPANGDLLNVSSNGLIDFTSRFNNSDAAPGATFHDSTGWGTIRLGTAIFCSD